MMNAKETNTILWQLAECLHGLIFSADKLSNSIVRLIFLKYAVDNNIGATDVESIQCCAKAQKMFAMRDIDNGLDTIIPLLNNIDRAYKLDSIISSNDTIEHYAAELFGMNRERQKKNANDQGFKRVMDKLGSLDLEETSSDHEFGKLIVNALIAMLVSSTEGSKVAAEYSTSLGLAKLGKAILNVAKHDTYCDFVSGKGISTIEITGDTLPDVINTDINREAVAISAMLMIMYGYTSFKAICENSLTNRPFGIGGNKIFVDPPIGIKLDKNGSSNYTDSSLATLDLLIHGYLSTDGIAVMTIPSGPLFRQGPAVGIKNEIITLGLLRAVVALPPMWNGASIGTNLLVLSKKPSPGVLFVDASDRADPTDKKRARVASTLSEETIRNIAEVINKPRDIPGFAKVVSGSEISAKELNLVPANYVIKQTEEDTTTLAEIDDQLAKLYRQLEI